MDVNEHESIL